MLTNKRLSKEILVLLAVTLVISAFLFCFLESTASSLCYQYLEHSGKGADTYLVETAHIWIQAVCLLAVVVFFVVIFLFLLGQKLLYLRKIISGIEALRTHHMDYVIPVEGNNEFTELAQSINYLSQTEQQLMKKEAAMTEERERFIRSIAHDIRTPLTSILSYSELMDSKQTRTTAEVDTYIELTLRKAQQMKELMERLLENNIRNPQYFENGQFLLQQIVDDWEEVLSETFTVEADWTACANFTGYFDLHEIFRVFDNLLSNIKKYADAQQPVHLQLSVSENHLTILQTNTIASPAAPVESHHMGLETIDHIVSQYGGTVSTQCTEGQFAITIRIPVNA